MVELNQEQKAAVETDSKNVLILAGAGSGKTRVLTERIAHLIENNKVSPYEILAITFTRKAAGEMRTRLEDRLGPQAGKVEMSTMHALALKMIHKFGEQIGLKSSHSTVYSEWESTYLLRDVAMEMGLYKKGWKVPKKEIDAIFNEYYQTGQEPDADHPGYRLFRAFIQRCKENNALTYGSLLIGLQLLIPTMAKYLHYRHILVDETQDIDLLQWQIINQIVFDLKASLFATGDVSQSIFEWRGAYPGYLVDNQDFFDDIYRLETNYRSTPQIVTAANNLIRNNELRLPLEMKPVKGADANIVILRNMDSEKLQEYITVLNYKELDVDAVLSRNHVLLKKLSDLLEDAGIDHIYVGEKTALANSEEFRRFHAFLKLTVNPYDNFAFLLIRELIFLSRKAYQEIRSAAVKEGKSHFQAWLDLGPDDAGWKEFFTDPEYSFQDKVIDMMGYQGDESVYEKARNFVLKWINNNPTGSIRDYLDWLATIDLQDDISEQEDKLILSTIHGAKGLEWKTVLIIGVNEGMLPSKQAIKNDEIESERRLCYVGITRAEDNLILAVRPETSESESGKIYHNPASRFLEEM